VTGSSQEQKLELSCTLGNDRRDLSILPKDPGCELHYSKFGESQVIATSVVGSRFCEDIRKQVVNNLESAGYACK
jgi:hypothetical protein